MDVPDEKQHAAIDLARQLVRDQHTLDCKPHERLWQIAKQLNVSRIEPGATRSQGFVKHLADGTYGVYYSNKYSIRRRRYTVAHELAHLVLEQFIPHIRPEQTTARGGSRNSRLERVVDRIASELLMPEHLVLETLADECQRALETEGHVCKYGVLCRMQARFGVSESAMAFRLIEVPGLLAIILRVMFPDAPPRLRKQGHIVQRSEHCCTLLLLNDLESLVRDLSVKPVQLGGKEADAEQIELEIDSHVGRRALNCAGWMRLIPVQGRYHEYWIMGWTWDSECIAVYDDSTPIQCED